MNGGTFKKNTNSKIRFIIVDDHPLSRGGISALISMDERFVVAAEAGNAEEAISRFREDRFDFAIIDITLDGIDGLQLIKRLRKRYPDLLILVVSMHDEIIYAERVLEAGARGYVMKKVASETILDAIHTILSGKLYISPEMETRILNKVTGSDNGENTDIVASLRDRKSVV